MESDEKLLVAMMVLEMAMDDGEVKVDQDFLICAAHNFIQSSYSDNIVSPVFMEFLATLRSEAAIKNASATSKLFMNF